MENKFQFILTEIDSFTESGKQYSEEFTAVYKWLFVKQRSSIEKEYLDYYSCAYTAHKLMSRLNHSLIDDGEIYYALISHNGHIVDQGIIFDKQPEINDFSYESYILSKNFILKRNGLSPNRWYSGSIAKAT